MSDLEFQRELSPEQIREALSLLDSTAGAQNQNLRIGDLSPAEEVNLEPDQSSTTMATQDRPPAAEDPQQRKKHLNLAVAFFGIGIVAAGALALLSWRERVPPPPMLGIAHEQPPKQSAAPAAKKLAIVGTAFADSDDGDTLVECGQYGKAEAAVGYYQARDVARGQTRRVLHQGGIALDARTALQALQDRLEKGQ